jgi:S-adenosylmethionine-diacylgycerolhomoserine-N-methlytransferase
MAVAAEGMYQRQAMNRMYRYQRLIYDASRAYYLLGRDRLIGALDVPPGGRVLEVGCGTGRNLIKAARRYPHGAFYGIDISDEMLKQAAVSVSRAGLSSRIHFAQADATGFDPVRLFGVPAFDRICFSYALSMIPAWQEALRCASGVLAKGGSIHIVDFGQGEGLPPGLRNGLRRWLALFGVEPRAELLGKPQTILPEETRWHSTTCYRGYAVLVTASGVA